MSERGYIMGATRVHAPFDETVPPSPRPGYGTAITTLCGRHKGGVYTASVALRFGLSACKWCAALSPTLADDVERGPTL